MCICVFIYPDNIFKHKKIWQTPIFTRGIPLLLSAITSLTAVFGMGTGVSSYISSPEILCIVFFFIQHLEKYIATSLTFFWLSPRSISTGQLNTLLHLHSQPIKHVCLHVILLDWLNEISYLVASFTLRCFQRLSLPDLATQLCTW